MIELKVQVQSMIATCVFGMCFGIIWSFLNRILYRYKNSIFRIILEILISGGFSFLYFYLLLNINGAIINIYIIASLLVGLYIYERYYAIHFLTLYETMIKFVKKLIKPIYFYFRKKFAIIKKKKRMMKQWIANKKTKLKQKRLKKKQKLDIKK